MPRRDLPQHRHLARTDPQLGERPRIAIERRRRPPPPQHPRPGPQPQRQEPRRQQEVVDTPHVQPRHALVVEPLQREGAEGEEEAVEGDSLPHGYGDTSVNATQLPRRMGRTAGETHQVTLPTRSITELTESNNRTSTRLNSRHSCTS